MSEPILIIGGGPAGSASAMNLLRAGLQAIIIEAEVFPRFHIGESLTTECVEALNRLGLQTKLEKLSAPRKNGVRIFSKHPENSFYVGAGDAWQVERARFDKMLLDAAIERGAQLVRGKATTCERVDNRWQVNIKTREGKQTKLSARFIIDASGQRRFSHRQGVFPSLTEGQYARQIAFFSQYKNITKQKEDNSDTLIFHRDAHEWCWLIPLSQNITSVGLVIPVDRFKKEKVAAEEYIAGKLKNFSEPLAIRFKHASRTAAVRTVANYSYQMNEYAVKGFYCVGDSHRFIDPIFSYGVEFAVVEAEYAAKAITHCLDKDEQQWQQHEQQYMQITTAAQNTISDMLAYFWAHPWGFANMAHMRHKAEFLELFAGRIYEKEAEEGLMKMRAAMA